MVASFGTLDMAKMRLQCTCDVFAHSIKYSCLYLAMLLTSTIHSQLQLFDSITLTLEGQDSNKYNCILNQSQAMVICTGCRILMCIIWL